MLEIESITVEIERCQKFAAYFVAGAGMMRVFGFFYLRYMSAPNSNWTVLIPALMLGFLAIGIYRGYRWAWAAGFLLCAILAYQLLIGLLGLPWSAMKFSWALVLSISITTVDLVLYSLSMIFLFKMQYKQNRSLTESSTVDSDKDPEC